MERIPQNVSHPRQAREGRRQASQQQQQQPEPSRPPNYFPSVSAQSASDPHVDAVQKTIDMKIRRGNRRGSIQETDYRSTTTVSVMREFKSVIQEEFDKTLEQAIDNGTIGVDRAKTIRNFAKPDELVAYVTEFSKSGNCQEFSEIIYNYIRHNTELHGVYKICLLDPDLDPDDSSYDSDEDLNHQFVITTPNNIEQVQNMEQLDPQTSVVVDAWHNNRVQTLGQFYAGDNPYRMQLEPKNLGIAEFNVSDALSLYMTPEYSSIENEVREYMDRTVRRIMESPKYIEEYNDRLEQERSIGIPEFQPESVPFDSKYGTFNFERGEEVLDTRNDTGIDPRKLQRFADS